MTNIYEKLGINLYFYYPQGKYNSITDVSGVKVGYRTIIKGKDVRTGVTVIIPPIDIRGNKLIAGGYSFNANGEYAGLQYILEEGRLISPIFLTNTFSVGDVYKAVIDYYKGAIALPVIGECWDGYLNDIVGRHVKSEDVIHAIENSKSGKLEQGSVGAGTGMTAFGFKAGIGTSSRIVKILNKYYTVGILVNNNLGNETGRHKYLRIGSLHVDDRYTHLLPANIKIEDQSDSQQSSAVIVIATDLPLSHRQLNRISKRAILGMGRIGAVSYSDSGDFVISFSTHNQVPFRGDKKMWTTRLLEESLLDPVFEATVEATEEAFLNSFLHATTITGKDGHTVKSIPLKDLVLKQKADGR